MALRQNFSEECENILNNQINLELSAFYYYLHLALKYSDPKVNYINISNFMSNASKEEYGHALDMMKYMQSRGGTVKLCGIEIDEFILQVNNLNVLEIFQYILDMEKNVNTELLYLYKIAENHKDSQLCDFLDKYLEEQVKSIEAIARHVTSIVHFAGADCNNSLGLALFDKNM